MVFGWIIKLKMSERKSLMGWSNLDSSIGFNFNPFDSNSRNFGKIKEQSISQGFRDYLPGREEEGHSHPFNIDNTVNFSDLDRKFFEFYQPLLLQTGSINSSRKTYDGQDWAPTDNTSRRGLKYLAFSLFKSLRKKRYSSHRQVAEEVQRQLMSSAHLSSDSLKEQKNIKRRIYDALNVMISAGVLERDVQQSGNPHLGSRNYSIVNRVHEHKDKLQRIILRIQRKKELLAKMQQKRMGLRAWTEKKMKEKGQIVQRLNFPLIVLIPENKQKLFISQEDQSLFIMHPDVNIYSESDLLGELVKASSDCKQQFKTAVKRQDQYLDQITYI